MFHLTRNLLPLLEQRNKSRPGKSGKHLKHRRSHRAGHDTFAYSSGKAAVSHMTRVLAGRLEGRNVTVNAILPGPFRSRMMAGTLKAAGEDLIASNSPQPHWRAPGYRWHDCISSFKSGQLC